MVSLMMFISSCFNNSAPFHFAKQFHFQFYIRPKSRLVQAKNIHYIKLDYWPSRFPCCVHLGNKWKSKYIHISWVWKSTTTTDLEGGVVFTKLPQLSCKLLLCVLKKHFFHPHSSWFGEKKNGRNYFWWDFSLGCFSISNVSSSPD